MNMKARNDRLKIVKQGYVQVGQDQILPVQGFYKIRRRDNMSYEKPIPLKTQDNHPFWDAAHKHELKLQECDDRHTDAHPPGSICKNCGITRMSWESFGSDVNATLDPHVISYRPFI